MRKGFILSVGLFIALAVGLVLLDESTFDEVSILSIEQNYSRLITSEEESLSFPVYISTDDSFLTSIESIEKTYLENEFNQLEVNLIAITNMDYVEKLDGYTYQLFLYEINFAYLSLNSIVIDDAKLKIIYINNQEITIRLGDISLSFGDVVGSSYFDIERVYATTSYLNNLEYVSGIVIGFNNLTMLDISINEINIGSKQVFLDTGSHIQVEEEIPYNQDINLILNKEYECIRSVAGVQEPMLLVDYNLLFIPFQYVNEISSIRRFPIYISYTYMNQEYNYVMDDFRFISTNYRLVDNYGRIHETIYYYQ